MTDRIARALFVALAVGLSSAPAGAQPNGSSELYRFQADSRTHWISPENPTGAPDRNGIGM